MFLGNNITVKKHEKTIFLLLLSEEIYVEDLENVTVGTKWIKNCHTLPFLLLSFPCLSKSLQKVFCVR